MEIAVVRPDSSAALQGVIEGDLLISIDGKAVEDECRGDGGAAALMSTR